jgi:hypothetical protein
MTMKRVVVYVVFSIAISVAVSLLVAYLPRLASRVLDDTELEAPE